MKILYWAPYIGHVGTIKAVINSAIAMRKYGNHDVQIVKNHSEWEGYEDKVLMSGINIVDFGLKKWLPGLNHATWMGSRLYMVTVAVFGFFQLFIFMRRDKPDVLITNLISLPAIFAAILLKNRPKIIASIQGYPKFLGLQLKSDYPIWMKLEDALRKRLWNILYRKADLVSCMTDETKQKLISQTSLPACKIVVINNPIIDDEIFLKANEPVNDQWFFDKNYRRVIAIGRLTKQKDFMTLIKAVESAAKSIKLRVAIVGEGEDRMLLESDIKSRGLVECIKLYGFLSNPYPYLKGADLFVLTSLWEDPGHAILEAAALRIPIVSTNCPSGPEKLLAKGKGGELCPVGDVTCLSEKIVGCLMSKTDNVKLSIAQSNANDFSLQAHFSSLEKYLRDWR